MIFGLVRLIIWLAGVAVIGYVFLYFIGYRINWAYFEERKTECQKALQACQNDLVKTGLEGAKKNCNWECVDPKLLMKKDTRN